MRCYKEIISTRRSNLKLTYHVSECLLCVFLVSTIKWKVIAYRSCIKVAIIIEFFGIQQSFTKMEHFCSQASFLESETYNVLRGL